MAGSNQSWHVERGVPIVGIITVVILIAGQTVTAAWWASKLEARVDRVEQITALAAPQAERLTKVEVKLDLALDTLKDIQRNLNHTRN